MKKINCFTTHVVLLAIGLAFSFSALHAQVAANAVYICPMKCNNAVYEKAGSCSVCGMTLIVKSDKPEQEKPGGYVCPPCGNSCDNAVHEKPGACAVCGMALVEKGSAQQASTTNRPSRQQITARGKRVAIFIFDGVQIIDYTGPYEVFGQAGFEVFTVAEKADAVTTAMGMSVNPRHTFANHPAPNILVIPGGGVPRHQDNPHVIKWIQDNAKQAEIVLSVCNGAYFLAKAGLLDGLEATTFASLIDGLQAAAPKAKVVSNKRFVDNGKIITSAGLSSGIDGSLHVIEKLLGKGWAQRVATNLEYNWDPKSKYVRAALADKYLDNAYQFMQSFEREIVNHEGGVDHWETTWQIKTEASAAEILVQLNNSLATAGNWKKQDAGKANGVVTSLWKFADQNGKNWDGMTSVEAVSGEKNTLAVTVKISRRDAAARAKTQ